MMVAPAAKDRHCREIGGHKVVAHSGCLKVNLPSAIDIACRQVEEFAGGRAETCRKAILGARGFDATIRALKTALALTYREGIAPHSRRKKCVRTAAQTLERLLLTDFTSGLDKP